MPTVASPLSSVEAPQPELYFGDSVAIDGVGKVPVVRIAPAPALVEPCPTTGDGA
jgi:hypothetical protein